MSGKLYCCAIDYSQAGPGFKSTGEAPAALRLRET